MLTPIKKHENIVLALQTTEAINSPENDYVPSYQFAIRISGSKVIKTFYIVLLLSLFLVLAPIATSFS